jgi:hypothetical protein
VAEVVEERLERRADEFQLGIGELYGSHAPSLRPVRACAVAFLA